MTSTSTRTALRSVRDDDLWSTPSLIKYAVADWRQRDVSVSDRRLGSPVEHSDCFGALECVPEPWSAACKLSPQSQAAAVTISRHGRRRWTGSRQLQTSKRTQFSPVCRWLRIPLAYRGRNHRTEPAWHSRHCTRLGNRRRRAGRT